MAQAIKRGFKGAVRQVALGIRPKGIAKMLLLYISAAERNQGFEKKKGFVLNFSAETDDHFVNCYYKLPECINFKRPGPVFQHAVRIHPEPDHACG